MAMSLVLRNACRLNGADLLKTARLTPMKTFSSSALRAPKTDVKLILVTPVKRSISLTAPRLSANHSTLWVAEKALSAAFLGILPAAFLFPSQGLDFILATSVVMHQHWGLSAIATDYVRPVVVGPVLPKVAQVFIFAMSAVTLGGLYYFIYNDVGIAKGIKQLWAIKGAKAEQ